MGTETWEKTVELNGAEAVRARVRLGSGELKMAGAAASLLEGTFDYAPDWRPVVTYAVQDGIGDLLVEPPRERWMTSSSPRYVWDLRLGQAAPVDLDVKLGSGQAAMNLSEARLSRLHTSAGSGQVSVDLSGHHPDLERVDLFSASGRLGLILNGDYTALRAVELKNASGVIDVSVGGDYGSLERIHLSSASGTINVGVAGDFPKLAHLYVKLASGVVDLNLLAATWEMLDAAVDCVSGEAVVRYPAHIGVRVRFSSVTGRLDALGLVKHAQGYQTTNYEEAVQKLNLSMSTVSGKLTLQPADA